MYPIKRVVIQNAPIGRRLHIFRYERNRIIDDNLNAAVKRK